MSRNLLGPSHSISQFRKLNRSNDSTLVLDPLCFVSGLNERNKMFSTKSEVQRTKCKAQRLRQVEDPSDKVSENLSF